ncbi:PLP-dependent aminotransferase family protein [Agromyces intestinalis]|uniref:PLP-dependent aminotransferase family protein n=1 Tax=Agromyces intestinalis TaxID=2592652 RepID=A0A5C1YIF4_9MICO|nr:PLP-dependent aminotransferase family protein [Agromyces intestinalis]QEO14562.1 PLP-dependent aminotransferase family protein [Agromyces intestinalis]
MEIATEGTLTALDLAERIGGTRSEDIRRTIADLITSGALPPGTRLPTIRDVAAALDTSVGSVADAWTELRRLGLLDTRRRGGTTVSSRSAETPGTAGLALGDTGVGRSSDPDVAGAFLRRDRIDLGRASADPAFLPDPTAFLVAAIDTTDDSGSDLITPALRTAVVPGLSFTPQAVAAAPGMHAAMHLAYTALLRPGDVVAVEDPTCVRNLALLRAAGARVVPIASDADGPLPESVAAALEQGLTMLAFQPVAAVPLGASLTRRRRDELAELIANAPAPPWILEEDPAGPLGGRHPGGGTTRGESLGAVLPDRVLRVVHLARAFGPLLQTAVLAGGSTAVHAVAEVQRLEGARPNPLLQDALAALMRDASADALITAAAETYARRNRALLDALAARGISAQGAGGFFAWVPVADERDALLRLAEHGVSASPGSRSTFGDLAPHIRVATTRLPDDPQRIAELADAVAAAAAHTLATEDE